MSQLLTPKKIGIRQSFFIVLFLHFILGLIHIPQLKKNSALSSFPYSKKTVEESLINIQLKNFPIKIFDDDIIQLIKQQNKPIKMKQEKREKSMQKSKEATDSLGESDKKNYIGIIMGQLAKHKKYPEIERRREREGQVIVSFIVNPDGSVSDLLIKTKSRYPAFDEAALNTVKKATPLPKFDANTTGLKLNITIDFKLDE